ncbi:hypothetical protein EMIHUDRAFT_435496 [Emiliania huxleyi CCMP1516]|uniref:Uncharacterized protein n=2 Tax=Emiliania huxleyi TaxID=2903 RepID=A0A0D3JKC6_EMIH1|nr:hypothetical protein EMIHUDRAFT_435496 [Emiliania huxleyi CCMP1516]EOD23961.1 hypothetical protein EMIHUDRAFT_435496 [Emiliania huxleyi CCMP1516]|eukprot:XP_005776390.1 hypothetical protein EMIHUDRAFT_435496 [Emiliania huxleyi CCMP1516]
MGRRLVRLTPQRGWLAARRFPLGAGRLAALSVAVAPRLAPRNKALAGSAVQPSPFRSGSRPAVELRRVGCDALLATERSCESLSGGAMRGAPRGCPYWAGPRLGAARGLRL